MLRPGLRLLLLALIVAAAGLASGTASAQRSPCNPAVQTCN